MRTKPKKQTFTHCTACIAIAVRSNQTDEQIRSLAKKLVHTIPRSSRFFFHGIINAESPFSHAKGYLDTLVLSTDQNK